MKDTKTALKYFTIFQWKEEQEYLREQHKNGWRLVKINALCRYHFEKCEPQDVVYQLDYNPDGIAHKSEYIQMFHDCGWEYLQDHVGYSYFRKPVTEMNGNEEIFCDDSSRTDFMTRVFKGRIVPLLLIFLTVIIPQIVLQAAADSIYNKILMGIYIVFAVIYVVVFLAFAVQFWNCKK